MSATFDRSQDFEGSIQNGSLLSVEKLVYGPRLVSATSHASNPNIAYCVKEIDPVNGGSINVFVHFSDSLRNVRMTSHGPGSAASNAVVVTDIPNAEEMVCFLQKGQLWCMPISGGSAVAVTNPSNSIEGFKIIVGQMNRVWLLAVVDVPMSPESPGGTAMIFDSLMIRHWDTWNPYGTRHHLLLVELEVTSEGLLQQAPERTPIDVMQGIEADCPGRPVCDFCL
jgi:hypothetical protein